MPWELGTSIGLLWLACLTAQQGRCSLEAGSRHIDVRNVIWLGTSNVGHDLVFSYHASRRKSEELMTREEYAELVQLLRPRVSGCLGVSNNHNRIYPI